MSDDLIELIAPGGCDEANHGGARYRVDNDGRIRVPRDAAFWFIKHGGFRPVPARPAAPEPEPPQPQTTAPQVSADGAALAPTPRRVPRSK
jgi:hypothetical protein